MNQRLIGIIVIILAVFLATLVFTAHIKEKQMVNALIENQGTCFLEDGTCLHENKNTHVFFGSVLTAALLLLGLYLIIFDTAQSKLAEQHLHITKTLKSIEKNDKFGAFLSGFNDNEQSILKAVHEQEGITQATLRYRTGLSKTQLSLLLVSLEERKIISKKPSGKTNKIYIVKKF